MARVVIVGKYYPPFEGGIEVNTRDVAEYLACEHDVTAIVHAHPGSESGSETVEGVRVIRCRTLAVIKGQPISLAFLWEVLRIKADLYHLHAPNFIGAAALVAKICLGRSRAALAITHHTDVHGRRVLRALALPFYRALVRRSGAVIVTSTKNAAISLDLPERTVTIPVPLGIDASDFQLTAERRQEARSWRTGLVGAAPTVGFLGRHARYKGLHVLLKGLAALPGVHALIGGDGPYRASAESLARDLGVADRAHFLGPISGWPKLRMLASLDAFVFPSTEITETFGIVQLEAMAMGVPVIASDLPTGVTDVSVHGETAILVKPGDVEALASAVRTLFADRSLAARLAESARTAVRSRFSRARTVADAAETVCLALGRTGERTFHTRRGHDDSGAPFPLQ